MDQEKASSLENKAGQNPHFLAEALNGLKDWINGDKQKGEKGALDSAKESLSKLSETLKNPDQIKELGASILLWFLGTFKDNPENQQQADTAPSPVQPSIPTSPELTRPAEVILSSLGSKVIDEKPKDKSIPEEEKDLDLPKEEPRAKDAFASHSVLTVGDSIIQGMSIDAGKTKWEKGKNAHETGGNKDFIGWSGKATDEVLAFIKEKFNPKGKFSKEGYSSRSYETAIVSMGGNDITKHPKRSAKEIAQNIQETVRYLRDTVGIKNVIVTTRFPYDGRLREKWGEGDFEARKKKSLALRDEILEMHRKGEFGTNVEIVDFYKGFKNENGELNTKYCDPDTNDFLHPGAAYGKGIKAIGQKVLEMNK